MYLEERRPGTEQKMFSFLSRSRGKSGGGEEREGGRESWESMEALESTNSLLTSS